MRYSKMFGQTKKSLKLDLSNVNASFLEKGGFIEKQISGVFNYLPLGLRVLKKIQNIIRTEMDNLGSNEVLMPALSLEESWITTVRNGMDILFKLKGRNESNLVLNPTHEEIVTPLVQKNLNSLKDLPISVYQIQNKFRNEARAKSGILRGREFNMKDMYSFHADVQDLDLYYEKVKESYHKIFKTLGIGEFTYLTLASGGDFSDYSHEFQTLSEIGEDTIYLCKNCQLAINQEIFDENSKCAVCNQRNFEAKKAIEVGNIFKLHDKFTSAFNFVDDQKRGIEMGCYGIGPSRLMGVLVEIFHDDKGIIWPKSVAPYQVHLLSLGQDPEVLNRTEDLYQLFQEKNIEVLYDDRSLPAGEKFTDADIIGIPYRVVVSTKSLTQNSFELKLRNSAEVNLLKFDEIENFLS